MTALFPMSSLPGWSWSVVKVPQFTTKIQRSVSKRELRLSYQPVPTWEFTLKFDVLRDDNDTRQPNNWGPTQSELRTLMGFFLAQQGALTPFLYDDPTDDSVTNGPLINTATGTSNGDGTTTIFQLVRQMGGFDEPIVAPNQIYDVYANGTLVPPANYSVNYGNGLVTFTSAPASGAAMTVTFTYYFLCRFSDDSNSFENFLYRLWSAQEIKLQSVLL